MVERRRMAPLSFTNPLHQPKERQVDYAPVKRYGWGIFKVVDQHGQCVYTVDQAPDERSGDDNEVRLEKRRVYANIVASRWENNYFQDRTPPTQLSVVSN